MKTHTNDFKTNINGLGRQLSALITYGNTTLTNEDVNSINYNYKGDILKSVMKQLEIDSNIDIPLKTQITLQFGVLVGNSYEYLNYGTFIIEKSEKQENTNSYKLTCYDKMIYAMVDYEDLDIIYPITIRSYINAICTKLGLTFANSSSTFVNYDKEIFSELYLDENGNSLGFTFRDVLDQLAQVTASTICINDSGNLEVRYITNTNDTIDEEFLKNVNVNFGEQYGAINTIVLSRSAGADKISLSQPTTLPDTDKIAIEISDNQILNGNDRDTYMSGILTQLYGLSYYLNDFESTGICYYDLCDRYNVSIDNTTYSCVMLNDEINITQGLKEIIYTDTPKTSEQEYKYMDSTDKRINQTTLIVNKQQGEITALASQVNEIEEDIQNPTSTKQDTSIDIQDALDSPLIDFSLYGDTQQDSTTGKNKFDYYSYPVSTTRAGITITNNGDGSFTLNGTSTSNNWSIGLGLAQTIQDYNATQPITQTAYYISGSCTKGDSSSTRPIIRLNYNHTKSFIHPDELNSNNKVISKTLPINASSTGYSWGINIGTGDTFNNFTIKYQAELGTSATEYEEYTGGQPAPNPEFPMDIHNVSGDNTIEICGKNRLDLDNLTKMYSSNTNVSVIETGLRATAISTANTMMGVFYIGKASNLVGKTIRMKTKMTPSASNKGRYYLGYCDNDGGNRVSIDTATNSETTITMVVDNAHQENVIFTIYSNASGTASSGDYVDYTNMIITIDDEDMTYEAYTGNSQLISLGVENLFDKDNANILQVNLSSNTNISGNSTSNRTLYVPILPDTTYTISKAISSYFVIGTTESEPTRNLPYYQRQSDATASSLTITTNSTAKYLILWYWNSGDTLTEQQILDSIQIEKGSKANSYSPYGASYIELNEISTYQDYIYKENDRWFLHKEIGKVVLDGSETGWYYDSTYQRVNLTLDDYMNDLTVRQASLCNNFIYGNTTNTNNTFQLASSRVLFKSNDTTSKNNWTTWLSTHNTIVYYVLATPTDTEITDTTLLEQLNNLMTLPLYKNMTHITLTPNDLQPIMKIEYFRDTSINENFVSKEDMTKYYTKTETNAQIQITSGSIMSEVSRVENKTDANNEYTSRVETSVTNLQTDTSTLLTFKQDVEQNGVKTLKNTLIEANEEGITISKTTGGNITPDFENTMSDKYQVIKSHGKEISFMGYDESQSRNVARIDDIESKRATIGVHRCETTTKNYKKRTAWFYVGGGN